MPKIDLEKLCEIAQAADLINARLRVAMHMQSSGQNIVAETNVRQAIEACKNTKKRLEDLLCENT